MEAAEKRERMKPIHFLPWIDDIEVTDCPSETYVVLHEPAKACRRGVSEHTIIGPGKVDRRYFKSLVADTKAWRLD